MTNNLIIAAAWSGKTKTLVDKALAIKDKNILITTYTEANELEIKEKIIKANKWFIPRNITVQTWFTFLLENGVRPYQWTISNDLWDRKIWFALASGFSHIREWKTGKKYIVGERDFQNYYFQWTKNLKIYSDKISEFTYKNNEKLSGIIITRIEKIYDNIFIDEVQDLAWYDLELLKLLFDSSIDLLLVWDPRQGIYSTHSPRKNKNFKIAQIINFFEDEYIKTKLITDDSSLLVNYRSNSKICNYSNKLFLDHKSTTSGMVESTKSNGLFLVRPSDLDEYLKEFPELVQLRWDSRQKINHQYKYMTYWSSKWLWFKRVLIYPTWPIKNWIKDNSIELPSVSRSKFYVALTRAKYSAAIVYDYKEWEVFEGIELYK